MLRSLLISKARIRILEKYFLNPTSNYHVRGLVRELNEEVNAVRRELINLEECGLLKSKKDKNKLVYTLNEENPLIEELRVAFIKDSKIGKKILDRINNIENLDAVLLTQSFFTDKHLTENDIDILFIGNARIKDIKEAISELEKDLEKELRATAMKREDFDFAKKKKDPVITNLLSQKLVLIYGHVNNLL